jgi:hypothetical protein
MVVYQRTPPSEITSMSAVPFRRLVSADILREIFGSDTGRQPAPTLTEKDEVAIFCTFARASQPKDEERTLSKGTTTNLSGDFRLADNGGRCKEAFVHSRIRHH